VINYKNTWLWVNGIPSDDLYKYLFGKYRSQWLGLYKDNIENYYEGCMKFHWGVDFQLTKISKFWLSKMENRAEPPALKAVFPVTKITYRCHLTLKICNAHFVYISWPDNQLFLTQAG